MKKTVTLPDGTTEVLEGTPEEIAAHERLIRERSVPITEKKKKPEVLKGKPPEDALRELIEKMKTEPAPSAPFPYVPNVAPTCSSCGGAPCVCRFFWPHITAGTQLIG